MTTPWRDDSPSTSSVRLHLAARTQSASPSSATEETSLGMSSTKLYKCNETNNLPSVQIRMLSLVFTLKDSYHPIIHNFVEVVLFRLDIQTGLH